jgi:hypothetical protein
MRLLVLTLIVLAMTSFAQKTETQTPDSNVACTFEDGKQLSMRYNAVSVGKEDLPLGSLYSPGNSPMFLFSQTSMTVGKAEIPAGAFSVYVIPDKKEWTLVINKNVTAGSEYDEKQDLARIPMQSGRLGTATKRFRVVFAHVGPKQCNMRIYYRRSGAWAEFHEKGM